ncbi:MAG: hypothetical protein KGD65_15540 [Candidatus Lokiarchaeota archaeon]|nr:hypothetical protein [Candidatus Lokiarchaeota archaeon]
MNDGYKYLPRKYALKLWRVYGKALMRSKRNKWKIRDIDLEFFDELSKYLFKHRRSD